MLLLCTVCYGFSYVTFNYYSGWAKTTYRTAFISAAATYGIVVYKAFRARARSGKPQSGGGLAMVTDENVQYLAMALVWLFSPQMPLALLPFAVYSVFHVATYTRTNMLPTFQPQPAAATGSSGARPTSQPGSLGETIGNFVRGYYDSSMTLVAGLELALWFRIFFSAITFAKGSWILLVIYTIFFRSRYSQSSFVQGAFAGFTARIDSLIANQSTPPVARQIWQTIKGLVRQATEATDLRKFTGASQPVKKAQ